MRQILYKIYIFIIVIIIIANILSIYNIPILGFRIYRVSSGSMEPNLKIDDIIIIKEEKNYKVNDIVTYNINDKSITHRIIRINGDQIITKGDSNNKEDNPINKEDIIGKLVYKFTSLSFILYILSKPTSWILLFIIGFVITTFIPNKKDNK